jgi:hypothetical protein
MVKLLTNNEKGYYRDNRIIRYLDEWGMLDLYQIKHLLFPSLRTAQSRMLKLYNRGDVRRAQTLKDKPYHYWTKKHTDLVEHRIAANWARMKVLSEIKNGYRLYSWEYEPNYGLIRPDALYGIQNQHNGDVEFTFIEVDLSNNFFDKVLLYNNWYEREEYHKLWWAKKTSSFPDIWVITHRKKTIDKIVLRDNRLRPNEKRLTFKVSLYNDLLKECKKWKGGPII